MLLFSRRKQDLILNHYLLRFPILQAIGSINTVDKICRRLAKRADAAVLSVDYRLSPEHKFPAHLNDVEDAYIWLINFAKTSGVICPKKLSVSGDSAGGNLAAALNVRLRNSGTVVPEYRPKYQLLVYPCLDLSYSLESHAIFREGYGLDTKALTFFQKAYLGENLDSNALYRLAHNPEVSPLFTDDYTLFPPTLLIVARADCLYSDSIEYAERLKAAGIAVRTVAYPGVIHGFFSFEDFFPEATLAIQECVLALKGAGLTGDQAVVEGPRTAKL